MAIAWGQGLVTVVLLFYFRLYCCSRDGKAARDKLLDNTSQNEVGDSDGGYGTANNAT